MTRSTATCEIVLLVPQFFSSFSSLSSLASPRQCLINLPIAMIPAGCHAPLLHSNPDRAIRLIQVSTIFEAAGAGQSGNFREVLDQLSLAQATQAKLPYPWGINYGCLPVQANQCCLGSRMPAFSMVTHLPY